MNKFSDIQQLIKEITFKDKGTIEISFDEVHLIDLEFIVSLSKKANVEINININKTNKQGIDLSWNKPITLLDINNNFKLLLKQLQRLSKNKGENDGVLK